MGNQNARWREASDVIPMFPTFVWKIELEAQLREAIGVRVLSTLAHLRRDLPPLAPGHGWQSVQSLHGLDEFRDLVSCVRRVVPGILQFLRIGYDAYEVTACWAAVLARGAAHKIRQRCARARRQYRGHRGQGEQHGLVGAERVNRGSATSSSALRAKALPGYRGACNSCVTAWRRDG
jgi:hypothetical protein